MNKTRSYLLIFVSIILAGCFIHLFPFAYLNAKERSDSTLDKSAPLSKISKLSIPFVPNQGQIDKRVKFYANTFGGRVFVTEGGEIIYSLPKVEKEAKTSEGWVLKEELLGRKVKAIKAEEKATARVSYFIGNDPSLWRSNIPTYGLLNLGEVYRGIKVKLRVYGRSVEKLFYVKAGANPKSIRLRLSGGESFRVDEDGGLEVKTDLGEVKFSKPVAYQEINGRRVEVCVKYDLPKLELSAPNSQLTYGFKLGDYDRTRELVIDPLLQSTYLGGSDYDYPTFTAIDSSGNVYVAGFTESADFPGTTGGAQFSYGGGTRDVFVVKLNSTLTSIIQSTYLGGSGIDEPRSHPRSIALDSSGNLYVLGRTTSTNFPGTAGGAQPAYGGGTYDLFVAKLNSGLTSILQSTYLGGSGSEVADSIAIDSSGNVYVSGQTYSTNFPGTAGGAQPSFGGGNPPLNNDGFVTKLNSDLTSILQSTYLGGSDTDGPDSITIDSSGNVYVAGVTKSTNFPGTAGGAQPAYGGGYDVFVAKLNPTLTSILQSTYLGGSGIDFPDSIVIDSSGNVYVAGQTYSTNFPGTAGGAQPSYGGGLDDAFVSKLNSTLTSILQSTYLGGSGSDGLDSITIDSSGNVYVAGSTDSTDFPGTAGGAQPSYGGGTHDLFVAKLNSTLTSILQSTYLGGSDTDFPYSIVIDSSGNVYVAGFTKSTDFPGTTGGAQPSYGGGYDVFVAKLDSSLTEPTEIISTPSTPSGPTIGTTGTSYTYSTGGSSSNLGHTVQYFFDWGDGSNSGWLPAGTTSTSKSWASSGTNLVKAQARCATHTSAVSDWSGTLSVNISAPVTETVSTPTPPTGPTSGTTGTSYSYSTGGSSSNLGHSIQYFFDWGDGTNSGWLPVGTTSASKSWASGGTYTVKAQARCATHTSVVSGWSGSLAVSISTNLPVFSDVPLGYWAYDYINAIYNAHITTGCSQNPLNYCPETNVTREQMAAFIVRAKEGEPAVNYCDSGTPFPDVTADMWSCKYIKRLKELGITTGYSDGRYGPYDLVPREQMAAFIVRAVEGEPSANYCDSGTAFPDVTSTMWSCKYIKRLKELNITTGYQNGTYGPFDPVTRAQMAALLSRAFLGMQ